MEAFSNNDNNICDENVTKKTKKTLDKTKKIVYNIFVKLEK